MKLFVGLGNPGSKYENHRHNIGFMAVDEIVRRHNFFPGARAGKKRWQALSHEGVIDGEKIIVIKPQTFMNESGRSVGEAMRFFKLKPADVIVFYDELDVAFGKVKAKLGGGAAGHNGIRSITAHIGAEFERVRIGIDHPGDKARVHGHVLGDFSKKEQEALPTILDAVAAEAGYLAQGDRARFLTEVARRLTPQRPGSDAKKTKAKAPTAATPAAPTQKQQTQASDSDSDRGDRGLSPMAAALSALKKQFQKED